MDNHLGPAQRLESLVAEKSVRVGNDSNRLGTFPRLI